MTVEQLAAFEKGISVLFSEAKIPHPVHLSDGNEAQLIDYFTHHVKPDDWCLCSWRSHLHCLLKGVPPDELRAAIIRGDSMMLCFPHQRILSSAIVGGIAPIAVGIAMGIKRRGGTEHVHCFVGDMTNRTGIVSECKQYASNFGLPLTWVVEDNGRSTNTPTAMAWNLGGGDVPPNFDVYYYEYKPKWPHQGIGVRVAF